MRQSISGHVLVALAFLAPCGIAAGDDFSNNPASPTVIDIEPTADFVNLAIGQGDQFDYYSLTVEPGERITSIVLFEPFFHGSDPVHLDISVYLDSLPGPPVVSIGEIDLMPADAMQDVLARTIGSPLGLGPGRYRFGFSVPAASSPGADLILIYEMVPAPATIAMMLPLVCRRRRRA